MRSKKKAHDLTASARVREAAIDVFGREGFSASVRRIAEASEVSPALVIHHFGSKEKLRAACDKRVLKTIRDNKMKSATGSPQMALTQLAGIEEFAGDVRYALRSLQAGGPLARLFFEDMVADAVEYMQAGVAAGTIRPSRDEPARARYLARQALGALLLELTLRAGGQNGDDPLGDDLPALLDEVSHELVLPALELYTDGLFTTSEMLDAYLAFAASHPDGGSAPAEEKI
jgi:AcrR family transcriptional regulator